MKYDINFLYGPGLCGERGSARNKVYDLHDDLKSYKQKMIDGFNKTKLSKKYELKRIYKELSEHRDPFNKMTKPYCIYRFGGTGVQESEYNFHNYDPDITVMNGLDDNIACLFDKYYSLYFNFYLNGDFSSDLNLSYSDWKTPKVVTAISAMMNDLTMTSMGLFGDFSKTHCVLKSRLFHHGLNGFKEASKVKGAVVSIDWKTIDETIKFLSQYLPKPDVFYNLFKDLVSASSKKELAPSDFYYITDKYKKWLVDYQEGRYLLFLIRKGIVPYPTRIEEETNFLSSSKGGIRGGSWLGYDILEGKNAGIPKSNLKNGCNFFFGWLAPLIYDIMSGVSYYRNIATAAESMRGKIKIYNHEDYLSFTSSEEDTNVTFSPKTQAEYNREQKNKEVIIHAELNHDKENELALEFRDSNKKIDEDDSWAFCDDKGFLSGLLSSLKHEHREGGNPDVPLLHERVGSSFGFFSGLKRSGQYSSKTIKEIKKKHDEKIDLDKSTLDKVKKDKSKLDFDVHIDGVKKKNAFNNLVLHYALVRNTAFMEKIEKLTIENKESHIIDMPTINDIYNDMKKELVGQDNILYSICKQVYPYVFTQKSLKPLNIFITGKHGTGKTYIAKVLANTLSKHRRYSGDKKFNLFEIKTTQLSNDIDFNQFVGAPPGYKGYGQKIPLFESFKETPNQILLFDEIEKGNGLVFTFFLGFFENGDLSTRDGKTRVFMGDTKRDNTAEQEVKLERVINIFTSNSIMSKDEVEKLSGETITISTDPKEYHMDSINNLPSLKKALLNWESDNGKVKINPAFIDRLASAHLYNILTPDDIIEIAHRVVPIKISGIDERKVPKLIKEEILKKANSTEIKNKVKEKVQNGMTMRAGKIYFEDIVETLVSEYIEQRREEIMRNRKERE